MTVAGRLLAIGLAASAALVAQTALPEPLRNVGIDQRLNQQTPLDLIFRDETGRQVALREYFNGKPVILSLVYYHCPMLCGMATDGLVSTLRAVPLNIHRDFQIVTVSFDPDEKPALAAEARSRTLARFKRPGAELGWHFLTGDEPAIRSLAEAVGFRYAPDGNGEFAHATAIMILTPDGRIARYLYGVEYPPRDLRLALVEASAGKIGSRVDQLLLYCFHYDPSFGRYSFVVMNVIRILGVATVLLLGGFIAQMFWRDRRRVNPS
ncbi:MAG: SCO family protein [Bryobacteraceae bacterium]|nr:SCO family protein [Bryobacteraceae bacterium]